MKITKASAQDLQLVRELLERIEAGSESGRKMPGRLGAVGCWLQHRAAALSRVLYGYEVLLEHCCDPTARTLEWKPEIVAAAAKGGLKL